MLEDKLLLAGKYFRALVLHTDFKSWKDRPKWQCKSNMNYCNIRTVGNSPEEAVDLFLERLVQSRLIKKIYEKQN